MIYVFLLLFALGSWQSGAKGEISQILSFIFYLLAIIILVIGLFFGWFNVSLIIFLIYFAFNYFILMRIFYYSTYHKYFKYFFLILISYGLLASYLLLLLGLNGYFVLFILWSTLSLILNYSKQQSLIKLMLYEERDKAKRKQIEFSHQKTIKYFILSSVSYLLSTYIFYILMS